jgi:hypothetical protein
VVERLRFHTLETTHGETLKRVASGNHSPRAGRA